MSKNNQSEGKTQKNESSKQTYSVNKPSARITPAPPKKD